MWKSALDPGYVHQEGGGLISGLVLAAGASTRFGRPKLVYPVDGVPLIRRSVAPLRAAGIPVVVVTAPVAGNVRSALRGLELTVIDNDEATEGVASSIRVGIRAVPLECAAVMILPGDQPDTPEALVRQLIRTFYQRNAPVVSPRYRGIQGPPVLFSRSAFPSLLTLEGDRGARSVLEAHGESVVYVDVDQSMPRDIDTVEDYEALVSLLERPS